MNPDASFCEKIENGMPYCLPKVVGPKPNKGKFGPFRVPFGTPKVSFVTPKVPNWPYGSEHSFMFGCRLDSFSKVFWPVLVPRHIFTLYLWFFVFFFWIIQAFLRTIILNNYLLDKSLKINLDNVQIIPNFVVIQSSISFLCMHPNFKH